MQLKKKKLVHKLGLAAFGVTFALTASADTFTATVTTIDDVTITEKQPLTFGDTIFTTAGNCTMVALVPGSLLMEHTSTATTPGASDASYGSISGSSCVTTAGSDTTVNPGVWRISGTTGGTVSLLVSTVAQGSADYTFVPSGGCYVNFSADNTDNADVCSALVPGTVYASERLASAAGTEDDTSGVGTGVSATAGDLLFTVGGVLTVVNPLNAETNYPLTFQVDVTY